MDTCYIACALDCEINILLDATDLLIGADRGYFTLVKNGYTPDVAIGDFDSYSGEINCEKTIKFPVKKDFTDSALAIEYAIDKGYKRIVIFGAIGGQLDHTLANLALLARYTELGIDIVFIDGESVIFAIHNSKISFNERANGRISVFSFGDVSKGVCENGLMYTLNNYTMENINPLGVSNEFIGTGAEISVKNGTLLIHTSKENYFNYLTKS